MKKFALILSIAALSTTCISAQVATTSPARQAALKQQQTAQYTATAAQQQPAQAQYAVQTVPAAQQNVTVTGGATVPVTTVMPVQAQPVNITERTVVTEPLQGRTTRAERREHRAEVYAEQIDSLIRSRNFVFYPNTMQEVPAGAISNIYADYYYLGIFTDNAEVHLPAVNGAMEYLTMLNFDSPIWDYRLYPFQSGLSVTFSLAGDGAKYFGRLVVSTVTGETTLSLVTPQTTMRYIGWLAHQRHESDN